MNPTDPLDTATSWIISVLLGDMATVVAVIAVAGIGFAMLQGHLTGRDGVRVLLGCVILFNAPAIAEALSAGTDEPTPIGQSLPSIPHPPIKPITVAPYPTARYDPYAGASVPK